MGQFFHRTKRLLSLVYDENLKLYEKGLQKGFTLQVKYRKYVKILK